MVHIVTPGQLNAEMLQRAEAPVQRADLDGRFRQTFAQGVHLGDLRGVPVEVPLGDLGVIALLQVRGLARKGIDLLLEVVGLAGPKLTQLREWARTRCRPATAASPWCSRVMRSTRI